MISIARRGERDLDAHRTRVSGRTIAKSWRQSTNGESRASAIREALSVRRADLALDITGKLFSEEEVFRRAE